METALGTADRLDVVPYRGPVTFNSTATSTSIFVQIKSDNIQEEDEHFELSLRKVAKRTKRGRSDTHKATVTDSAKYEPIEHFFMWQMVFDSLQQLTDVQNFGITGVSDWVLEKWIQHRFRKIWLDCNLQKK